MAIVRAGPNEYLLAGRGGKLENRGSAVQAFLLPGTIHVLVPSTKQEATFEFTQETKDGIPLRFKGIAIYRVTDPLAAATLFDFAGGHGTAEITRLLTHVVLGELRHAVSHMTMVECIEQRKTTLSGVAEAAIAATIHRPMDGPGGSAGEWGITVEVAQVAQVFIVDTELRQQLEAEVRDEIKLKSDQSHVRTREETRLAEMASEGRVQEQKVAQDLEDIRRQEEREIAEIGRRRRMQTEDLETQRQALQLEQQRFQAEMEAEEARVTIEAPVRLLRIEKESQVLRDELEMRRLQNQAQALEVDHELLLPRARQDMRLEILPLEQTPAIVEAASRVLRGTNLSIYGEGAELLGQLAPLFDVLGRAVTQAAQLEPTAVRNGKAGSAVPGTE